MAVSGGWAQVSDGWANAHSGPPLPKPVMLAVMHTASQNSNTDCNNSTQRVQRVLSADRRVFNFLFDFFVYFWSPIFLG